MTPRAFPIDLEQEIEALFQLYRPRADAPLTA
jgi:hypothetical protein